MTRIVKKSKRKQKVPCLGPRQEKFVSMLESGKIEKIEGSLCDFEGEKIYGYCALGVAELSVGNTRPNGGNLSNRTAALLGFQDADGQPNNSEPGLNAHCESVISMNDIGTPSGNPMSFKSIARVLRRNPQRYFTEPK